MTAYNWRVNQCNSDSVEYEYCFGNTIFGVNKVLVGVTWTGPLPCAHYWCSVSILKANILRSKKTIFTEHLSVFFEILGGTLVYRHTHFIYNLLLSNPGCYMVVRVSYRYTNGIFINLVWCCRQIYDPLVEMYCLASVNTSSTWNGHALIICTSDARLIFFLYCYVECTLYALD